MGKFYITTAIDYVNSLPHIGTAYEKITADCIARAKRLLGYDVRFCMGTDEHSVNVKKKALESGVSPQEFCNQMFPRFTEIWKKLSISYDDFIRTTEERHIVAVTALFRKIKEKGDIYPEKYKGWYCEGCESFLQEKDLVDGKCPNHMKEPAWIEEKNYFFKLSNYRDRLLDHIQKNPRFICPESRRNEIIKLLEGGLEDISVSRSGFDWGIPLPDDPSHVVYVWFDALINYISALGYGSDRAETFIKYWPADVHIIGKDITRFHCVIWPAMLMSAGIQPPKSVFGHGFINHRGEKMSKSLGNVVNPLDIVDRYGADSLRFFLLREVVYGQDGDFTYERFIERYNSDLANDLGNLVSRTLAMIHKYCGGKFSNATTPMGDQLTCDFYNIAHGWQESIENYDLSGACTIVMKYVKDANKSIENNAPWNLAKDPNKKVELEGVLYDLSSVCVGSAILLSPYIPLTAQKIWEMFGNKGLVKDFRFPQDYGTDMTVTAPVDTLLSESKPLFPRIEVEKKEPAVVNNNKQEKPMITFDDFAKLDIRIGTILSAERIEGSTKLLRLRIDDGLGGRTLLAGIAQHYEPENLVGKQVSFIANLEPRKMMGEYSNGMVLAAVDNDNLSLLSPVKGVSPGTKVS